MKYNKLFSLICVVLLCCCLTVTAWAAPEDAQIELLLQTAKTTLTPGETVQVSVLVNQNPGNLGLNFDIKWDTEQLEILSVDKSGSAFSSLEANQSNSKIVVTIGDPMLGITAPGSAEKVTATGKVLNITFKPKTDGETAARIYIERASFVNLEGSAADAVLAEPLTLRFMTAQHTHTPGPVSCTEPQKCTVCGAVLADKKAHEIVNVAASAPSCGFVGWEAYEKCANCSYTTYVEIPATGKHTFGPWEVLQEPTAEESGKSQRSCTVCKLSEIESFVNMEELPDETTGNEVVLPEHPFVDTPAPQQPADYSWVRYVVVAVAAIGIVAIIVFGKKKPGKTEDNDTLPD